MARLGVDGRRLRPNIVIAGAEPRDERQWPGRALRIGDALIGVHSQRPRCIVTTIDPDTGEQDLDVLRRIRRDCRAVCRSDGAATMCSGE
ncbi:MOSC domain-containing protein [Kribbella sp. NPDC050124]|uniref:MOSC domain-containing protein n=1 Tax=Kribbella sp. NPDC050124 TaxID=3364114 RepID=UPI0037B72DE8